MIYDSVYDIWGLATIEGIEDKEGNYGNGFFNESISNS